MPADCSTERMISASCSVDAVATMFYKDNGQSVPTQAEFVYGDLKVISP